MAGLLRIRSLVALCVFQVADAGVTIHYTASVASAADETKVVAEAAKLAKANGWNVQSTTSDSGRLPRFVGENARIYKTKVVGIRIEVAPNCEPLHVEFGSDLVMQDFVKTQFAGADVHIRIIRFLEKIRPLCAAMDVMDEGGYWGTHDRLALERNLEAVNLMLAKILREHPEARGPVSLGDGRIGDVVH